MGFLFSQIRISWISYNCYDLTNLNISWYFTGSLFWDSRDLHARRWIWIRWPAMSSSGRDGAWFARSWSPTMAWLLWRCPLLIIFQFFHAVTWWFVFDLSTRSLDSAPCFPATSCEAILSMRRWTFTEFLGAAKVLKFDLTLYIWIKFFFLYLYLYSYI